MNNNYPKLFLAHLTGFNSVDVICIQNKGMELVFTNYCDSNFITYLQTCEEDAAKILITQDGVGFGCYTMYGYDPQERPVRRLHAMDRLSSLVKYTGVVVLGEPMLLTIPTPLVAMTPNRAPQTA